MIAESCGDASEVGDADDGDADYPLRANRPRDSDHLVVVRVRVAFRDESGVGCGAVPELRAVVRLAEIRGIGLVVPVLARFDPEPRAMEDGNHGLVAVRLEDEHVAGTAERPIASLTCDLRGDDTRSASRRRDAMFVHHDDHVGAFDVRSHAPADDGVGRRPDARHRDETGASDESDDDSASEQATKTGHDTAKRRTRALLSTACRALRVDF
ncbi:hypothetical protein [Haladaptatus halobius]|uniref:hypothetical protein n=1 Tax=Haladaptatus halobius TaxID=2884875 RepID=UPI001D0B9D8B|nr:hypothetical protein [Haladaptatus halobius]